MVLGLIICAATSAQTHPFSIHDMLAAQRLSDPQISPDGKQIVFVLRTTDIEADRQGFDLDRTMSELAPPSRLADQYRDREGASAAHR